MLLKDAILQKIKAGEITLVFRRWTRSTVRSGGTLRTAVGVLAIDDVSKIDPATIADHDARQAGFPSRDSLLAEICKRRNGDVYRIALHFFGPDPRAVLRSNDEITPGELDVLKGRLNALDVKSRSGAWTARTLELIAAKDGCTAGEIADALGLEKAVVKRKIRALKELGLTESLHSGYKISAYGRAALSLPPDGTSRRGDCL
jgi:biotin operon repressor